MSTPASDQWDDARYIADLARLRARVNLSELVGPSRRAEVEQIRWAIDPWALGKETVALHQHVRSTFRQPEGELTDTARRAALLDARAWESLGSLGEGGDSFTAFINSAVSYEFAGYQANAACVARAAERAAGDRLPARFPASASAFIQRQFFRVAESARALNEAPTRSSLLSQIAIISPDTAAGDLPLGLSDDDLALLVARAYGGQALLAASRYFLSGTRDSFDEAMRLLSIAEDGFVASGAIRDANLASNLATLIPVMRDRSTWVTLGDRFEDNPRWRRYLQVLARGMGDVVRDSRSISELWPSQLTALNAGLLDSHHSLIIRMPTSAGKTRVAELAIIHALLDRPGCSCLYIAPFRALADEVQRSLDTILGEVGFAANSLVGGPEFIGIEEILAADSQVLVLTPEKADLLLRSQPELLANVAVVVLDEGQIVGDEYRGTRFELLITRLRRRLPNARFLFLSAVVPQQTLDDFAAWLGASRETGVVESRWRPAIQRVAAFEWTAGGGTLRYRSSSEGPDELAAFARFLPRLIPERVFTFINPETGRRNTRRFPDPSNRSHLIAALAYEFVKTGPVLMFCPQTNFAESCAKALQQRVELGLRIDEEIPAAFTRARYQSAETAARWLGEEDSVTALLRRGIGVHHGRLPDAVRRAVEDDYRAGALRVLAATSTLAQGVNLPVRTVLIHSARRRDEAGQEYRIPARDYWNIAGRAGRAGFETDGLTIHLTLNNRDRDDLRFFLENSENVEPVDSSLLRLLDDLTSSRISSPQALAEIDPGLMALLVEEGEGQLQATVQQVDSILRNSLVGLQAERTRRDIQPLVSIATAGAQRIATDFPFADLSIYSRTGLTSESCSHLARHVTDNRPALMDLLSQNSPPDDLISLILDGLSGISEMQPRRPYDGNYSVLAGEWMSGRPVPEIARRLVDSEGTDPDIGLVARAIEEIASYLFPWGFSAYLQLAIHLLEIEPPTEIMALPGLVRYGVPQAVAAWLMGFGLIDRLTAIGVAGVYTRLSGAGPTSPGAVREWLGRQDPALINEAIGGSAESLRELAVAINRTRRPQVARGLDEALLPRTGSVMSGPDLAELLAAAGVTPGASVTLARDYDTALDRNSIVVLHDNRPVGRLDGLSAALLALEMDAGTVMSATAGEALTENGQIGFEISIEAT